MNNLINIQNKEGSLTLDSREVAKMVGKNHADLLRDIRTYIEYLGESKTAFTDFFIESSYISNQNKELANYQVTKKGCEFIAHKLTGQKGAIFTATYINRFHVMEKSLKEVYHISETAIVNNIMEGLEEKIFSAIDERLSKYEDNYRPTHANKIDLNNYIKGGLGEDREHEEVDLVKQRILLMLNGEAWQDIPYKKLIDNMKLIDESIRAVKSFRVKSQISMFED